MPHSPRFGDLKVRLKLIVLHNLFFLVLTCAVYFTLIPFFDERLGEARLLLFAVLGIIYLLAVGALEWIIMPRYVYRPLRLMLHADAAARQGDRARELIDETQIPGDEIGQIMRSRNETLALLRHHEAELKALNQDLQRKNLLLETAKRNIADQDRLASLGMLSASVAHELNTPLAVLHGSIEKLIETVTDHTSQDRLARMLRVTERLRRMGASLVDFARVRRPGSEMVHLHSLIEESWSLVAIDEKAARVHFNNLTGSQVSFVGSPDRLIQLFVNLLRNALLAVQSGGTITVSCRSDPPEEHAQDGVARRESEPRIPLGFGGRASALCAPSWIYVLVDDDGPGIPAHVLPDIFEAFVTTRLDARGTGLGLTVAEGIAHQHGGSISAANRPGGGARLEVRLPAPPQSGPSL
ncbi:MAG: hypothetical protein JJE04_08840 [Acidobacteriia bacterium]|nr:hypothetical protein [Terriglobia bacterium]